MKTWIVILALLLAGGAGVWAWQQGQARQDQPAPVPTARVVRGELTLYVEATGSVESNLDVDVKSKASGKVLELPRDVGDRVPQHVPGQNDAQALLAALDPVDENRKVERARAARDAAAAALDQTQAALETARQNLKIKRLEVQAQIDSATAKKRLDDLNLQRRRELAAKNATTQNELDVAIAAASVAQANLDLALAGKESLRTLESTIQQRQAETELAKANLAATEAELAETQQRLSETRIYSPIAGVVTRRDVQEGQIIASGIINVAGGTTLMTVSDMSRMFVQAEVHESDIGHIVETGKLGQEVTITADAYPGRPFTGKVVQITPRGVSDARVINFMVKVEVLDEQKNLLLPKMTTDVKILARRSKDVLLLPTACLHYDRDRSYVERRTAGGFEKCYVRLGLSDGTQAEVLEGLAEGDEVAQGSRIVSRWVKSTSQP